jgi:hypothetical protein
VRLRIAAAAGAVTVCALVALYMRESIDATQGALAYAAVAGTERGILGDGCHRSTTALTDRGVSPMAPLPGRSRHIHAPCGYAHVASLVASAVLQVLGARPARAQSEPQPPLPPPPTELPALPPPPPPTVAGPAPRAPVVVTGCRAPDGPYCHDGLYLRLGLGPAYSSFLGTGPQGAASISGTGVAFSVAVGGPIARGFVVGGTLRFADGAGHFTGAPADATSTGSGYFGEIGSLFVDWYPDPERGWHAGALVGLGNTGVTDSRGRDSSGAGFAFGVLAGHDWWIGPQWSLGVLMSVLSSTSATMTDSNGNSTGYSFTPLVAALEASILWH